MGPDRPRLFIGSSTPGLSVARKMQAALDRHAQVTVWEHDVFQPGLGTLAALLAGLPRFHFAILIFTPDDIHVRSDGARPGPRDNVLLELGLFLGRLGSERVFVVHDRTKDLRIPTDLSGVTLLSFEPHDDGVTASALGACATLIVEAIERTHWNTPPVDRPTPDMLARSSFGDWNGQNPLYRFFHIRAQWVQGHFREGWPWPSYVLNASSEYVATLLTNISSGNVIFVGRLSIPPKELKGYASVTIYATTGVVRVPAPGDVDDEPEAWAFAELPRDPEALNITWLIHVPDL
ncbi:MAG: TIR domain-containing protein [Dehalococcoidia bacterium]